MEHATARELRILPIAEEHIEGFHRCLGSVVRERRYLAFVKTPPLEAARRFVLSNIAGNVPQFVALHGEDVVGWCDISPFRREGFAHCGSLGMGVRKDHRRLGIGESLLEHALAAARELGLERVELEVFASNTPAIRLYEKAGFVVEGTKTKGRKLDGEYDDLVQMALFI